MISASPLLKIGTRGSPLALAQAHETKRRLADAHPELRDDAAVEIVVMSTLGDRVSGPLTEIGGKGLFTQELEEALQSGAIDLAVHSMKDMPTWLPDGLKIAAMLPREDPRDLLLVDPARLGAVARIADLPKGAVVGSSALRRQAQLLFCRPDLKVVGLRGNVGTRMRKLSEGQFDMTLLALDGINRLGIDASVGTPLGHDEMLPAVAQGAIGIEINMRNQPAARFVEALDHSETHRCVAAERAMLAVLDGSCRTPIAGYARLGPGGMMTIEGLVAKPDGSVLHRQAIEGDPSDSLALGVELGHMLKQQAGDGFL